MGRDPKEQHCLHKEFDKAFRNSTICIGPCWSLLVPVGPSLVIDGSSRYATVAGACFDCI